MPKEARMNLSTKCLYVSIKIYDLFREYFKRLDFPRRSGLETHECMHTEAPRDCVKEQVIFRAY